MSPYRDCYRWIDPWEEMDRFDDYLEREREYHDEAMRRVYRAMADENQRDRAHVDALMKKLTDRISIEPPAPIIFPLRTTP